MQIPNKFLKMAEDRGIPERIAKVFYARKMSKKGWEFIALDFLKVNEDWTLQQAKALLTNLWKEWDRSYTNPTPEVPVVEQKEKTKVSYLDQARNELEKLIGPLNKYNWENKKQTEAGRVIAFGDIHFPFQDDEKLAQVCNDPAEVAIITGDILDNLCASTYRKEIDYATAIEEFSLARAWLEKVAKSFKKVYVLKGGNHDSRPMKRVQELLPQLMLYFVHPVVLLCQGLENVEVISWTVPNTAPAFQFGKDHEMPYLGFLFKDVVVGHFDNFYGHEAPRRVSGWIGEWHKHLQLPARPRLILHGHTHKLSMEHTGKDQLLVSTGCLCRPMPYQFEGHGKYSPGVTGYCVFYVNENGYVDLNRTRLVSL